MSFRRTTGAPPIPQLSHHAYFFLGSRSDSTVTMNFHEDEFGEIVNKMYAEDVAEGSVDWGKW